MKLTAMRFRKRAVAFLVVSIFSVQVNAQLTEYDAVRLGLKNPHVNTQWDAQLETARGEMQHAGRWQNPSIEYSREELDLPGGASEEATWWLRQTFNIAGVLGLQREAAAKSFAAEQKQQQMNVRHWQKNLREAFYQTLAAQQKSSALIKIQTRMQTIETMVKQRAERGDASRFDALRIAKELSLVVSKNASAQAKLAGLRHALFSMLDAPFQAVHGTLLPNEPIADTYPWSEHPQLQAMQSLLQSAQLSALAAGREHWPELTLGVGRKQLSEPEFVADGNAIAIGITIPLFDHGRGEKRIAESSVRALKAQSVLLQRQFEVAYQSALLTYRTNKNAAYELENLSSNASQSLSQLAEASYQAGELSVMELMDAYQSDLATTEQYIDTAMETRLAYIQLQYLRGE